MSLEEQVEGWAVDLACLRRYPVEEYLDRAREHSSECALMGHCVESGYGLVQDDGFLIPLDTRATPKVVASLQDAGQVQGFRIRVSRGLQGGEMVTTRVERAQL